MITAIAKGKTSPCSRLSAQPITILIRCGQIGVQVWGDRNEIKNAVRAVPELSRGPSAGRFPKRCALGLRIAERSFGDPIYHAAGVRITDVLSDAEQVMMGVPVGSPQQRVLLPRVQAGFHQGVF